MYYLYRWYLLNEIRRLPEIDLCGKFT